MCDLQKEVVMVQPKSLRQNKLIDWFGHLVTSTLLRVILPHIKHELVVSQAILLSHLALHHRHTQKPTASVRAQVDFSKKLIGRANLTRCAKFLIQKNGAATRVYQQGTLCLTEYCHQML